MSKFPNMSELYLDSMSFYDFDSLCKLIGACGRLVVLSLTNVTIMDDEEDPDEEEYPNEELFRELFGEDPDEDPPEVLPQSSLFDLTALERLTVHGLDPDDNIIHLLDHSPPLALKMLTLTVMCHAVTRS
jgi:hypothetical protein